MMLKLTEGFTNILVQSANALADIISRHLVLPTKLHLTLTINTFKGSARHFFALR